MNEKQRAGTQGNYFPSRMASFQVHAVSFREGRHPRKKSLHFEDVNTKSHQRLKTQKDFSLSIVIKLCKRCQPGTLKNHVFIACGYQLDD